MTLEYNNKVPYHFNTHTRGKIVYFNGSDNQDLWQSNLEDLTNYEFFKENGWLDPQAIIYNFNTHGFRCEEFDDRSSWVALGCSFTQGVGLNIDDTWVSMLAKHTGNHIWNLGVGSAALDSCFRILDYYIDKLNVQGVFLLQPPNHRFELFVNGHVEIYLPKHNGAHDIFYKSWHSDPCNSKFNAQKNILAMEKICDDRNVRFITRPSTDLNGGKSYRQARDLMHHGKADHMHLADLFYEDYNNGNS